MSQNHSSPTCVGSDTSPDDSPRRSWRSSSRASDPPASSSGQSRSARRRRRRSQATSRARSSRDTSPPGESAEVPSSARDRSPTTLSTRGRSPTSRSDRGRHLADRDRSDLRAVTRTVVFHDRAQAPSSQSAARHSDPPGHSRRSSESTLTASSPALQPGPSGTQAPLPPRDLPPAQDLRSQRQPPPASRPVVPPPPRDRPLIQPLMPPPNSPQEQLRAPAPPGTPPGRAPDDLELPRTPGYFSSPEVESVLDVTRLPRPRHLVQQSPATSDNQWDRFSTVPETPVRGLPPPPPPVPEAPLSWTDIVELVYQSGLINTADIPASPVPVRSVIGGPQAAAKRRTALPPSPLASACLPAAMRSCWGGPWTGFATHQPPPPNAALHPGPATWVQGFKARYYAAPGLDLRPARPSAREREWTGTHLPPVDHSWVVDLDTMARAQLAALSNLEWLFGIFVDSNARASPLELDAIKGFIVRELQLAMNFGGAQIAAATLARRQAILDSLQHRLSQTTRNWLQLQPVELRTNAGLFGTASAQVPEILRQQPLPQAPAPRRRGLRGQGGRGRPREAPSQAPAPQPRRQPAATYTPTASAAAPAAAAPRPQARPRGRGGRQPPARGSQGPKQRA